MVYLFAPMEGITFAQYRTLHSTLFPGTSEYYTPFIAPDSAGSFKPKYLRELTAGCPSIPQLLVNNADAFNATAIKLTKLGFEEINLNIGCPSGTVYAKYKGAGMLRDLESLSRTLDGIYNQAEQKGYHVSIKTRMGVHTTAEFPAVLHLYRKYPVSRLIIHARCRDDFYSGSPDIQGFADAALHSPFPLVYNGDIASVVDLERLLTIAPDTESVMIGRGAVLNPAIFRELQGGEKLTAEELSAFLCSMTEIWLRSGLSPKFTAARMKTLWQYMKALFPEGQKQVKAVLKAKSFDEYQTAVRILFDSGTFRH